MMRLGFITQWFSPEPVVVPRSIPDELARRGWNIRVLTGKPNYPDGRIVPGYQVWGVQRERMGVLDVFRVPLFPSHDRSALRRALNYLSWAFSATLHAPRILRRADVNLVYGSPITAALPAIAQRLLLRTPYVLFIQDLWPDSIFASGFLTNSRALRSVASRLLHYFANLAYRLAADVAVIAPGMHEALIARGVPSDKIHVVYNWADESVYVAGQRSDEITREALQLPEASFLIMYAGNHGAAQGLETVITAISELPADVDVTLVLVGDGLEKERLMALAQRLCPERVRFLDPVPSEQVPLLANLADALLVSLTDSDLFRITIPSKVQAFLALGKPLLFVGPGDGAEIVTQSKAGAVATPNNVESVKATLQNLAQAPKDVLDAMGQSALAFYKAEMSSAKNGQILDSLLRGSRRRQNADKP